MIRARAKLWACVEERTQPARGTWPKQGPDRYVAVQVVPPDVEPLVALRHDVARKRGIRIIRCGEGYGNRRGPKSALGQAREYAETLVQLINGGMDVEQALDRVACWPK